MQEFNKSRSLTEYRLIYISFSLSIDEIVFQAASNSLLFCQHLIGPPVWIVLFVVASLLILSQKCRPRTYHIINDSQSYFRRGMSTVDSIFHNLSLM